MTISSVITDKPAIANGSTTQFPFPNKIFAASDLVVTLIDLLGNQYVFVNQANSSTGLSYTVTLIDIDTGCLVTFSAAPTNGWTVDIRSATAQVQSTSIKNQGSFLPELHEEFFDRITRELQDLLRITYTYGIHGPDTETVPWPALPGPLARRGMSQMYDPVSGLPTLGVPNTQTITTGLLAPFLNWGITSAEGIAGVTPVNLGYPPYTAPRYGVVFDGATDNTTAMNNAAKACCQAGATLQMWLDGTVIIGRLAAFTGALKIRGTGAEKCIIKVNPAAWPYTSNTNPVMQSTFDFQAEDVGFDMSWVFATFGSSGGSYNDGANPNTWGGNWFGTFTGANFRVFRCGFYNITRGFLVTGATNVEFSYNIGMTPASDAQSICATALCTNVRKDHNFLVGPKWTTWNAITQPYLGLACLYCFGDVNVQINHNSTVGYQMVQNGNSGTSLRCVFMGNLIETPPADCAFQNWVYLSIHGNIIHMSGDMGIATDNSNYVSVTGNVIDSVMTGCINVGGAISATVVGNVCKDWMQGYALVNAFSARFSSSAGGWGAGITASFTSPDTGGFLLTVTGNSLSMPTLPPVSDIHGPIRAAALGIYIGPTPSGNHLSGSVVGNYMPANYAQLPSLFAYVPVYESFIQTKTGTPIPGEKFTSGGNSFIYIFDSGGGGGQCQYKHLIGATPNGATFTGALSGATVIMVASNAGPFWLSVKESANFDFTEVDNTSGI